MRKFIIAGLAAVGLLATQSVSRAADAIQIVAAENFYGQVAEAIGGPQVAVTSILSNPNQDPHLFEAAPSTARAVSGAAIAIVNGADYDPWMIQLLNASPNADRTVITVADLIGRKPGDNPHLWYDPATMPAVAKAIAAELSKRDPAHADAFAARLKSFEDSLVPLNETIAKLKAAYAGTPVTATEPVFGYMATALGLDMRNYAFQLAIMNDAEPSASDVAAFDQDLTGRKVKVLFYNSQVTDDATERLLKLAKDNNIPVVGVTETEPANTTYVAWMTSQLDALNAALGKAAK